MSTDGREKNEEGVGEVLKRGDLSLFKRTVACVEDRLQKMRS